eukprot:214197-Amphidinium_carterae.1
MQGVPCPSKLLWAVDLPDLAAALDPRTPPAHPLSLRAQYVRRTKCTPTQTTHDSKQRGARDRQQGCPKQPLAACKLRKTC